MEPHWKVACWFFGGAAGMGGEAVGTGHMSDTSIRVSAAPRQLQPRETLGEKLKSSGGSRQPGLCRAGRGRSLAAAHSGKAARGTCGTGTHSAHAGLSRDKAGSWQVLGRECVFLLLADEPGWTVRRCWDETRLCVASARGQEWGGLRLGPVLPITAFESRYWGQQGSRSGIVSGGKGYAVQGSLGAPSALRSCLGRTAVPSQPLLSRGFAFPPVGASGHGPGP